MGQQKKALIVVVLGQAQELLRQCPGWVEFRADHVKVIQPVKRRNDLRRFPDLLTQRLLKSTLIGQAPEYSPDELRSLAAHCTAQEDNAAKVERQVAKSAAALLLAPRVGQRFDAIVTGASDKGTWVRIPVPTAEGKLIKGFEGLDVGDQVQVKLVRTDIARGFIDFERLT